MNRYLRLCLVSALLFSVACGKNNEENNTNTNNMTSTNNGTNATTNNTTGGPTNNTTADLQCDATGDACDPAEDVNADFVCILDDAGVNGVCRSSCSADDPCPSGSLCGAVSDGGPNHCIASDCNGWLDDSCGAGEACVGFTNDVNLCTTVGTLADGAACESTDANPLPCGPGLFCGFGECTPLCGADTDCASGERCIEDVLDSGVGICAVGCDSYSFGQCPAGEGCFPVTEVDGVCDTVGTAAPWEACTEPEDCGENTACITFQSADPLSGAMSQARCLPFCNPVPETANERDATCPQPGGTPMGYGRFAHLAEGAGMVDIYVDGTLTVNDLAFEGVSNGGAFFPLTVGAHVVEVTAFDAADNSAPLLTANPDVTAATILTWGIVPDATTTIAFIAVPVPRGITAPAAGSSKLRPVHAIPDFGPVDVVAVAAGATDFTAETVLALNLATGTAAADFTEVPAGSYDIYLFQAGTTPRDTANANGVTVAGVVVPADVTVSVYARGTAADTDAADPGLTNVAYASAPAPSGALGGFCLDLGEEPSANSGFCIEECPSSDTFGTGACTTAIDQCTPLRGGFGCFPAGTADIGEACDPDVLEDGCNGVGFCEARGDGTGVCTGYCQPTTQSNVLLGCASGEECIDRDDNFGLCGTPCTPDANYADTTTCPAGLQTCHAADIGESSYCGASGSVADGGTCVAFAGQCQPGHICANQFATAQEGEFQADGACTSACDPFGDNSDCGTGEACQINSLTLSRAVGHCQSVDEDLAPADPCAASSVVCGQTSFCLDIGRGYECVKWCDLEDATSCPGSLACTDVYEAQDQGINVGFCL